MATGVPFELDSATVPLREDLMSIPASAGGADVVVLVSDLEPDDVVTQAKLIAKVNESDTLVDIKTQVKTITAVAGADGVIEETSDSAVRRLSFLFTAMNMVYLATYVYGYAVQVSITRGGNSYKRIVQLGRMNASDSVFDIDGPIGDGTWFGDGIVDGSGFNP
jgi:hypothetical protein